MSRLLTWAEAVIESSLPEVKLQTAAALLVLVLVAGTGYAQQPVLSIEPNQSRMLAFGASGTYWFYSLIQGDTGGVVELTPPSQPAGWNVRLLNAAGSGELTDTDGDQVPDLGYLVPGLQSWFSLEVTSPARLTGDTTMLDTASFVIPGYLGGRPATADSAFLTLSRPPTGTGLSVHNFPNPLTNRTAFVIYLPVEGKLSLNIYTRAGERVCRVLDRVDRTAGIHTESWEAVNDHGQAVAPGTYEYVLDYERQDSTERVQKKLVVRRE
jgi:hypothetical protein